jgi:hypothetical protein
MRRKFNYTNCFNLSVVAMVLAIPAGVALAQDQTPPPQQPPNNSQWRHMTDPQQSPAQTQNPEPIERPDAQDGPQRNAPPAYGVPAQLTLKSGTYVNVRINQMLSSDRNHAGDTFSATLTQPVIVDGIVVAPRGQVIYGRVADAEKAHAGKDSRLGLELMSITLADGTQAPVTSQLVAKQGPHTPGGQEAGTIIGTTAVGAAVGGIAGRAQGAAIGAGAGAAAGIATVLLTHNHPTVLYPETALTFSITTPVTINTANAPQAYRYVGPEDYQGVNTSAGPREPVLRRPAYVYGPGYYDPYYYPYYPYGWGPGFGVGVVVGGPRFYGGFGRRWR